jgi:hypothetical protein
LASIGFKALRAGQISNIQCFLGGLKASNIEGQKMKKQRKGAEAGYQISDTRFRNPASFIKDTQCLSFFDRFPSISGFTDDAKILLLFKKETEPLSK